MHELAVKNQDGKLTAKEKPLWRTIAGSASCST